jgi:hypothetical protein
MGDLREHGAAAGPALHIAALHALLKIPHARDIALKCRMQAA